MRIAFLCMLLMIGGAAFAGSPKDSVGVKYIDGRKFILHKIEKKETLFSVSKKYNVSQDSVVAANKNLKVLKLGMVILIPAKGILADTAKGKKTIDEAHANADAVSTEIITKHKVQKGETLNSIAQKYNITTQDMTKWNNLKDGRIEQGQVLIVNRMGAFVPYQPWNKPKTESIPAAKQLSTEFDDVLITGWAVVNNVQMSGISVNDHMVGGIMMVTNIENKKQVIWPVSNNMLVESAQHAFLLRIDREKASELGITDQQDQTLVQIRYLTTDK